MRAFRIEAAPFVFTDILDVKIRKGVNQLGNAWIKGVIAEENEDGYVKMALSRLPVAVSAIDINEKRKTVFQGFLENINISSVNGLKTMELFIASYNKLLDITPGIKVFQDTELTYDKLVAAVLSPFDGADFLAHCGDEQAIGQMFVQYQETAWAFVMRMASMWEDVLLPDDTKKGVRIHFGFPDKYAPDTPGISPISYDVRKDVRSYMDHESPAASESDYVYYIAKDREIREPGEPVFFQGCDLYVTEMESRFEGQELIHIYTLRNRNGIRARPYRNFAIIGASLSGQVSAITGSHVRMSLPAAHSNDAGQTKWHPFSTIYSTPDGTGWYAMPEKGDSLRLYYPTEIENDGYTVSAVHHYGSPPQAGGGSAAAGQPPDETDLDTVQDGAPEIDPKNKFIENNSGKFILLTPYSIMMACEGGSILIQDGEGISITSNYDLNITANGDVNIASLAANATVVGTEGVNVEQAAAKIELSDGNVIFKGAEVQTN
ncbi:MAG: hypothetical protein LBH28_01215 [Oscillospiraceae bacterium]|jgi:hypothetical protein|nr:hypothetical protein [Oscillospiraceae bacterium]